MKIREALDIFDQIWDKYTDEGLDTMEKVRHLNTAQVLVLTDSFYNQNEKRDNKNEPRYGFENTQYESEDFRPLLVKIPGDFELLQTDSTGKIQISTIEAFFPDDVVYDELGLIEERKCPIFHINYVKRWSTSKNAFVETKWVRHNEVARVEHNPHKKPTDLFPTITYYNDYVLIRPKAVRDIEMSVTRMPKHMRYVAGNAKASVDPELPYQVMLKVILRATQLAGVNSREKDLYQLAELQERKQ